MQATGRDDAEQALKRAKADAGLAYTREARAFTALQKVEDRTEKMDLRVKALEVEMPGLKEVRAWVIGGVLSVVSVVGIAAYKLVMVPGAV